MAASSRVHAVLGLAQEPCPRSLGPPGVDHLRELAIRIQPIGECVDLRPTAGSLRNNGSRSVVAYEQPHANSDHAVQQRPAHAVVLPPKPTDPATHMPGRPDGPAGDLQRDKVSLDLTWLRDESLEDLDNLPPPDVIAREIVEDLEAALAEFSAVAESLGETS